MSRRWTVVARSSAVLAGLALAAAGCADGGAGADGGPGGEVAGADTAGDGAEGPASDAPGGDTAADTAADGEGGDGVDSGAAVPPVADQTVPPEACDASHPPMVWAHGFMGSGDTFANHVQRFAANGWCASRMFVFDWNTVTANGADLSGPAGKLDTFIDGVLDRTGASQVVLAGHSMGGGLGYTYLADAARAAKVARYVHIGSGLQAGPAGPDGAVPTLNVWSDGDLVVSDKGAIAGATDAHLIEEDHYAVATSAASFEAIYTFVAGTPPTTTAIAADGPIVLRGFARSFAENTPAAGGALEIWAVAPDTGLRARATPDAAFTIGDDGAWGPFVATADTHYELVVTPLGEGQRRVRFYREPFVRSNPLVYARTLPGPGSIAGALLSSVPFEAGWSSFVVFSASQAVQAGRDSLTLDGVELATEAFAAPENTTLALFLYDADADGVSSVEPIPLLSGFPFLAGVDVATPADPATWTTLSLNGRTLHLPRWPGDPEGAVVALFD